MFSPDKHQTSLKFAIIISTLVHHLIRFFVISILTAQGETYVIIRLLITLSVLGHLTKIVKYYIFQKIIFRYY